MSTAVEHAPIRPAWSCGSCGGEWPCAPAKIRLSEEHSAGEDRLLAYLAVRMWEAFDDGVCAAIQRHHAVPPVLRERFLDWVVLPMITRGSNAA